MPEGRGCYIKKAAKIHMTNGRKGWATGVVAGMGRVAGDGNHPVPIPQEPAKLPLIKLVLGALRTQGSKASGAGRSMDPKTRAHERGSRGHGWG